MLFEFYPSPPRVGITQDTSIAQQSSGVVDHGGEEEVFEPSTPIIKNLGLGPTPSKADMSNNDLGSSNIINLNDINGSHPGLVDKSVNVFVEDNFCSYVNQSPVLETAASVVHSFCVSELPAFAKSLSLPPTQDEIPSSLPESQESIQKVVSQEKVIVAESQELLVDTVDHKRKKECLIDDQDNQDEKRLKIDSSTVEILSKPIPPTLEVVEDQKNMDISPSLVEDNNLPEILSPSFVESGPAFTIPAVADANLFENAENDAVIREDPVENNVFTREDPIENNVFQSKIPSFIVSESQDLALKGFSLVNDSQSVSEDESVSIVDEAEQAEMPRLDKESSETVEISNLASSSIAVNILLETTGNSMEHRSSPRKLLRKSSSTTSSATKKTKIAAYSSTSTEADNSNDEDYHPTQHSPAPFIPVALDVKVKAKASSSKKLPTSSKCASSELGVIPSSKKKKTVKFEQDCQKVKIFSKLRIAITISTNATSDEDNAEGDQGPVTPKLEDWMLEKDKLSRKIREHGGIVEKDILNSFSGRKMTKSTILVTLTPLRTKKFLLALSLGVPIVSVLWLAHCINEKTRCDFNAFRLSNGPSLLLKQPCAAPPSQVGIFKGISIYIYPPSASKQDAITTGIIKDWAQILTACEAKIVGKKLAATFVLVLISELSEREEKEYGPLMISTEYVIQCLRHQTILSRNAHPQFTRV